MKVTTVNIYDKNLWEYEIDEKISNKVQNIWLFQKSDR